MSAISKKNEPHQLPLDFSPLIESVINKINNAGNDPVFSYDAQLAQMSEVNSLLEKSSTGIGEKTTSLLVGESFTDVTLEEAESLFLNNNGYVLFALEAIRIAAKDILNGEKTNASTQNLRHKKSALEWLSGDEDSLFPFKDCVKLLDYELRFQSMNEVDIPDIANNPQVIRDWVINNPEDAAHYLKNYQSLFNSQRRSGSEEAEAYEELRNSASPHQQQGATGYERPAH